MYVCDYCGGQSRTAFASVACCEPAAVADDDPSITRSTN